MLTSVACGGQVSDNPKHKQSAATVSLPASNRVVRRNCKIENIPLPCNSVDVVISNCVINLSGDRDRVLAEAFRVLKPGGRFAVSDVVRGMPAAIQRSMAA